MSSLFEQGSNFDGAPASIQFFKELENTISETDEILKILEEIEARNWIDEMEAEEGTIVIFNI